MNNNLLISLLKYKPKEGRTPFENFITEIFAWLLRNNPSLIKEFFKRFESEQPISNILEIVTQYNLSGHYLDMVLKLDNVTWIFEHKTFARLSENQLSKYRELGQKEFGNVKLALITASQYQHEQKCDLAITWEDVYCFLSEISKSDSNPIQFLTEFTELLKENGLGPQPALSYESIIYYLPSKDFRTNLQQILWKIHERIEQTEEFNFFFNALGEDKNDNLLWNWDAQKYWGRVGTEFLKSWRPGIFIGCIVDNKDHCNSYKDYSKGIDYSLILCFDQETSTANGKIDYLKDDLYGELVNEFMANVHKLEVWEVYHWEVYHHVKQENEPNPWHPIYLRCSLADILIGKSSQEEQVEELVRHSKALLAFILNCKNFLLLRDKYKVSKEELSQV